MKKKCNTCGELKDIKSFYRSKASDDGYMPKCKKCFGESKHHHYNLSIHNNKYAEYIEEMARSEGTTVTKIINDIIAGFFISIIIMPKS